MAHGFTELELEPEFADEAWRRIRTPSPEVGLRGKPYLALLPTQAYGALTLPLEPNCAAPHLPEEPALQEPALQEPATDASRRKRRQAPLMPGPVQVAPFQDTDIHRISVSTTSAGEIAASRKSTGSFSLKAGEGGAASRKSTGSFSSKAPSDDSCFTGAVGFSVGSEGHPYRCNPPCKYVRKARGCKDGDQCAHCHLCLWRNTKGKATTWQGN
mmetsp:Transcript_91440/g.217895  ORF Transcript_91440/g.217895 Transcript_91440/m.217895 type:complete len:214 (-) Transcript_91440:96-737(-)